MPLATWERVAPWLFVASLLLLVAVLIPKVGSGVNGARRLDISLGFHEAFQPLGTGEVRRGALRVRLHGAARWMWKEAVFFRAVLPMAAAVAIVGSLLLAEPDMGAFMVIAVIAMGILFLGGVNARHVLPDRLGDRGGVRDDDSPSRTGGASATFAYLDPFGEKHALGKGY